MKKMIEHVALRITDLNRSIAFYRDVMGFSPVGRRKIADGNIEQIVFRVGEDVLVLFFSDSFRSEKIPSQTGVDHVAFSLEKNEYYQVIERLKKNGVKIHRGEVKNLGAFGIGYATYFYDPDNIEIEIKRYDDPPEEPSLEWYD